MRINDLGYRLDLSSQLLLNLVQSESVIISDEIDGDTQVAESARATNTMQVGFGHLGEVEVDHDVNGLDVDTSGEKIRANQVTASATSEIVEYSVTVLLTHLGVNIKARVAQFGDLLGKQLDPLR